LSVVRGQLCVAGEGYSTVQSSRMNLFSKIIVFCICVAFILPTGCGRPSASTPATKPTDVGPTYVRPNGTGAAKIDGVDYQYVATREREAQIVAGFPKLKLGQTREQVRNALGPPDFANPEFSKAFNSQFLGWSYQYYIKERVVSPNMNDPCVEVFFDPNGKITWAVPENIAGLKEIGGPGHPPVTPPH
jgi:hypothetical protein